MRNYFGTILELFWAGAKKHQKHACGTILELLELGGTIVELFRNYFGTIGTWWNYCGTILELLELGGTIAELFRNYFGTIETWWNYCGTILELFWNYFGTIWTDFAGFTILLDFSIAELFWNSQELLDLCGTIVELFWNYFGTICHGLNYFGTILELLSHGGFLW